MIQFNATFAVNGMRMRARERVMNKVMTKGCACNELDDDLKDEGWTCYACYEGDNE